MVLAHVGAGKTATALTAMQDMLLDGVVKRFLVLAPKRVAVEVWPAEADKWARKLDLAVAVGTQVQRRKALASDAQVVVANYDCLQWLALQPLNFDGVVFDELTRLKNASGARFKALLSVIEPMRIRWGLTGSFTSNGLEDVFGQCKIIDQRLLGRAKGAFLQKYFILTNKDYGEWTPRRGALEQVMQVIKPATYLLDAVDYKDTLPPLHTVEVRCDIEDRAPYEKMKRDLVLEHGGEKIIAINAAVVTGKLQQLASGFIYSTTKTPSPDAPGKFTLEKKPVWVHAHKFDTLENLLTENQRDFTIIAYTYQEELEELKRRYPRAVTLDSKNAVERWNRKEIELLLVHPKSAGHGLNLQFGGSSIVFLSLPWSLELFEQTVGRLHRSGQVNAVWCYVLIANKTIDEKIWVALHDKKALADIATEGLR
jgi:SNF2 family DNA or RNA helicase